MLRKRMKLLLPVCLAVVFGCFLMLDAEGKSKTKRSRKSSSTRRSRRTPSKSTSERSKPVGRTKVTMKNGETFRGLIMHETDMLLVLDVGVGQLSLKKEDIEKIEQLPEEPSKEEEDKSAAEAKTTSKKEKNAAGRQPSDLSGDEFYKKMGFASPEEYQKRWGIASLEEEAAEVAKYEPGSTKAYEWVDVKAAIEKAKKEKLPVLFYYFDPSNRRAGYYFEKKLFENPRFEKFKDRFIMVKSNSIEDIKGEGKLAIDDENRGKTGVRFLDYHLNLIHAIQRIEKNEYFRDVAERAEDINTTLKLQEAAQSLESQMKKSEKADEK